MHSVTQLHECFCQHVGDAWEEEWAARSKQKKPEEGGRRKDYFFFWQYCLISSTRKTVSSLQSHAGGIVIKNCDWLLILLLLKTNLQRHLFGLIYLVLFPHKLTKYLKNKIGSNTAYIDILVCNTVNTLFSQPSDNFLTDTFFVAVSKMKRIVLKKTKLVIYLFSACILTCHFKPMYSMFLGDI